MKTVSKSIKVPETDAEMLDWLDEDLERLIYVRAHVNNADDHEPKDVRSAIRALANLS